LTSNGNNGMFSLAGKTVIVTGGASGIGQAVAEMFAAHGAGIHILDLNAQQADMVAGKIRDLGGSAQAHACDVSVADDVKRVVAGIISETAIDILVNSAGIPHVGKLEETTGEDLDRVYAINVKGTYHCMRACIEHMKSNRRGVILNLASIASSAGIPDRFAYSMSKGAVVAMTYSVARDYLGYNIRCNCISPARVRTPFVESFVQKNYPGREDEMLEWLDRSQPVGRMGNPCEVAALALFLCSQEADFITGSDYPMDGGFLSLR
jgi:NAD(P)-dependent dehydrogenase (short-subunit alcohol dehydrogenase family)